MSSLFTDSFGFNHHAIVFTETWLNANILNSEIFCNNYIIYRRDRITHTSGGGVLVAVSNNLPTLEIDLDLPLNIEFIAIKINFLHRKVFITCSYIPPNSDQTVYLEHCKAIKSVSQLLNPTDLILVFGDFNLPFLTWKFIPDACCYFPINTNNFADEFLNNLSDMCLLQKNYIFNDYNRLLDLVFTNEPADCTITRHTPISSPEDKYHPTIEVMCNFELNIPTKEKRAEKKNTALKEQITII